MNRSHFRLRIKRSRIIKPGVLTKVTTLCVAMVALLALVCFSLYFGSAEVEALPPRDAIGNPPQVSPERARDVEVEASEPRVRQSTAFTDCCVLCGEQTLEALVPTPQGPQRLEGDRGLPLRRKFCGTITRYGVLDEAADPRDIMINILPDRAAPYPDFVAGFINTEGTPLKGNDLSRFGPAGRAHWNLQTCLQRASEIPDKVIHAEVTPDEAFYGADGRFLPINGSGKCSDGWDCQSELEPRSGVPGTEACVYGVYAIDHGGHSASSHTLLCCSSDPGHDRPEIHPFDAVWWRHPELNGWMFGVFQDDSNRYSFPHCDDDNNGNEWSQAPRDLTFRFPFRFPRRDAPQRASLRHVRTRNLKANAPNVVRPKNVTTGAFVNPQTEITALVIGGVRLLEVVKESGTERETHVRVEGRIVGGDVVGQIILRVAVGCDDRQGGCVRPAGPRDHRTPLFDRLRQTNGLVAYDKDDPGAGYFYAELTFTSVRPTRIGE